MAGPGDREPRTVLEHLLRQQDRTYAELAGDFEKLARMAGERATISPRHLARLARGERAGAGTNPTTRRVLQKMFGRSMEELLAPWSPAASAPVVETSDGVTLRVDEEGNVWAQVDRRTVLVGSLAALLAQSDTARAAVQAPDDPYGFAANSTREWPGLRLSRPVPDYGVDWQLLLPRGRSMPVISQSNRRRRPSNRMVIRQKEELLEENAQLRAQVRDRYRFENIIGDSPAMHEV